MKHNWKRLILILINVIILCNPYADARFLRKRETNEIDKVHSIIELEEVTEISVTHSTSSISSSTSTVPKKKSPIKNSTNQQTHSPITNSDSVTSVDQNLIVHEHTKEESNEKPFKEHHLEVILPKINFDDDLPHSVMQSNNETDVKEVTTEFHFDINRYTSDYNIDNPSLALDSLSDTSNQINHNTSDAESQETTVSHATNLNGTDFTVKFTKPIPTTPYMKYFDEKHPDNILTKFNHTESDHTNFFDSNENSLLDRITPVNISLNDIHSNGTSEKNVSTFYQNSMIESTNFDVKTNEIRNGTAINSTVEKRGKYLQDPIVDDVNVTKPNEVEAWALAGMKSVEHLQFGQGEVYNITSETDMEMGNQTITKQLADWVRVVDNSDFHNSSVANRNQTLIDNIITNESALTGDPLELSVIEAVSIPDNTIQENQVIAVSVQSTVKPTTIKMTFDLSNATEIEAMKPTTEQVVLKRPIETNNSNNHIAKEKTLNETTKVEEIKTTTESILLNTTPVKDIVESTSTTEIIVMKNKTEQIMVDNETVNNHSLEITSRIPDDIDEDDEDDVSLIGDTSNESGENNKNVNILINDTIRERIPDDIPVHTELYLSDNVTPKPTVVNITTVKVVEPVITEEIPTTTTLPEATTDKTDMNDEILTTEQVDETTDMSTTITDGITTIDRSYYIRSEETTDYSIYATTEIDLQTTNQPIEEETTFETTVDILNTTTNEIEELNIPNETTINDHENIETVTKIVSDLTTESRPDQSVTMISINFPTVKEVITETTNAYDSEIDTNQIAGSTEELGRTPEQSDPGSEPDVNAIIAISVSVVGVVALILLVGFLVVMRKRQKQLTYSQRCRPVSLDAYSLDNVSVYNSVRRKGNRQSKRSYGNAAFDDPSLKHNNLNIAALNEFVKNKNGIYDEFKDIPLITARIDEVPPGCEDKNRFANVVPLPETRVLLQRINNDEKSEYINASYVRGPKDPSHYYIACQAPMENTVIDFWRMIWEQNSRVIVMATDLTENGIDTCAEYLPPSVVLDDRIVFGDYQVTLKNREVKQKYAVSTIHLKNVSTNMWREITHFWYEWPETSVPTDEATVIAMLLEARSYLKMTMIDQDDQCDQDSQHSNESIDRTKSLQKVQGPLTVHCSPGTGRTGTIISCDIAIRSLEQPTRSVNIPQIVYFVRRGRASAVRTRDQYEFIYKVAHMYATKLTGPQDN